MTNAPTTRKTHVIRILGTNKNGDVLSHLWADLERIDVAKGKTQTAKGYLQGYQQKFRWQDDPTADDYNPDGNPARETVIVKLCDPNSNNVNDPVEWIPIPVIVGFHSRLTGGADADITSDNVGHVARFKNSVANIARIVETRRICHYDTNIDAAASAAFEANPTLRAYVVPGDQYVRDNTTKDDSQHVEHEIITYLKGSGNEADISVRRNQVKLLNQYLIDESDPATLAIVGSQGINPPYRLDPFQNIVNVQFRTIYLFVSIDASNSAASSGPYPDVPSVGAPSISIDAVRGKGAKLLDAYEPPDFNHVIDGPLQCMTWNPDFFTAQEAYAEDHYGITPYSNGACDMTGVPPLVDATPIDFEHQFLVARQYLFAVPAVDGVIALNFSGLIAATDTSDGPNQKTTNGVGNINVRVWSTVRDRIKKLDQLVDIHNDGKERPTQDDMVISGCNSETQGRFLINVKQDKDKAHAQTDNWGNTYQPYKVTLDPGPGADQIPAQPPPRLPK
ncbi:hypothetical protein [Bradyrhizobium sp. USDA 4454]